jgi:hypothetical protein
VIKNIASFGGDSNQITINGESAGAGSVRVLLGSPPAIGKFQGAIAMSNLGGGVDLGINGDYATTYSSYDTANFSFSQAGQQIFQGAGCNQTVLADQITCLKAYPALKLVGLSTVARYVVQDGHYVNTEELNVISRNPGTAHVGFLLSYELFHVVSYLPVHSCDYYLSPFCTFVSAANSTLSRSPSFSASLPTTAHPSLHIPRHLSAPS